MSYTLSAPKLRPKPKAVLISDIHYNLATLPLADAALRQAVNKANELNVPLIIAGDLHDTKANMRGECMNAMMEALRERSAPTLILRGNHDSLNEKASDSSLNFLAKDAFSIDDYIQVINKPFYYEDCRLYLIPYQHDPVEFKKILDVTPAGYKVIMHQGITGSLSGDYIIDKSAIPKEWLADYRVISGHYHTRQDIKCGRPRQGAVGLASYVGNPYTLGFGEANDPEKGFQILMDDGTLEFVPTNLRKHVVINLIEAYDGWNVIDSPNVHNIKPGDLVKVKATASKERLQTVTKEKIQKTLCTSVDFKLELIPLETSVKTTTETKSLSQSDLLDNLIDSTTNVSDEQKQRLKALWKELI